jgi:hypothetical protein
VGRYLDMAKKHVRPRNLGALRQRMEEALSEWRFGEYRGFCWHCGHVFLDVALGDEDGKGPGVCSRCTNTAARKTWERAYIGECGVCGDYAFVHLHKPAKIRVSDDLEHVLEAAGICQCDGCWTPFLYRWWWRTHLGEGDYAETPGSGIPWITLIAHDGKELSGKAEELIAQDS